MRIARANKVDRNQPEIVKLFLKLGASVTPLSAVGDGCPDLLVGWQGRTYLAEVKFGKAKLTPKQEEWLKQWKGGFAIVRTESDVYKLLGIEL